jgi:hypothetical protein
VHEAGHAVVAWHATGVRHITEVRLHDEGGGHVQLHYIVDESYGDDSDASRWCRLAILLAGVTAETLVYGRCQTRGAADDLVRARELAQRIYAHPPWVDRAAPTLCFDRMFYDKPKGRVLDNLSIGYRMARRLLRARELPFYRVVGMLLARRVVRGTELSDVLGIRVFTMVVGFWGPRFIGGAKEAA